MERSGGRGKDAAREGNPTVSGYAGTRNQNKNSLDDQLKKFWEEMMEDVRNTGTDLADFKTQQLPLARIKKIMKSDEDVRMISAEAPVLFAKACEFFILEMTLRAWNAAEESKRRTLTRQDVSTAVNKTEVWDFLADTVPVEDQGVGHQGGIPGRPIGVTMPPQDMASMQSQMDPYQAQYMAQMANMNSGASGGIGFPPGVQPMPMMYQGGMPPGMYMPAPPVMNPQQQSDEGTNGQHDGQAKTRNQRR